MEDNSSDVGSSGCACGMVSRTFNCPLEFPRVAILRVASPVNLVNIWPVVNLRSFRVALASHISAGFRWEWVVKQRRSLRLDHLDIHMSIDVSPSLPLPPPLPPPSPPPRTHHHLRSHFGPSVLFGSSVEQHSLSCSVTEGFGVLLV